MKYKITETQLERVFKVLTEQRNASNITYKYVDPIDPYAKVTYKHKN